MDALDAIYQHELQRILARELETLDDHRAPVNAAASSERDADARAVLADARHEIDRARDRLRRMHDDVSAQPATSDTFNRFLFRAGPAFRAAVAARGLLLRHTPPLA